MKNFKDYLAESKNVHLQHLEDLMFVDGTSGIRNSINFLRAVRDMMAGNSSSGGVAIKTKWDGNPAIICGINPENGQFFVGTKSVFSKRAPKINYTKEDIRNNYDGDIALKLGVALDELSKLGIKNVIQGDLLFTKNSIKVKKIDNQKMYTFQPNTIVYAVPVDGDLGKQIKDANLGIVFHTEYTGKDLSVMTASFSPNLNKLKYKRSVWYTAAEFKDESGLSTFTKPETVELTSMLSMVGSLFSKINADVLGHFTGKELLQKYTVLFNNQQVREGTGIGVVQSYVDKLLSYILSKKNEEIESVKTQAAKDRKQEEKATITKFFMDNRKDIINIFTIWKLLSDAKIFIVRKLEKVKSIGTFVQDVNGLRSVAPEGFVAVDNSGSVIKLVDRMNFSHLNFTVAKQWG